MMRATAETPVLVVDDDRAFRESLMELLERNGLRAEGAADGAEAQARIARGLRPCVVLLDLVMPVMDGWAFLRWLRAWRGPVAEVPVVVITASPFTQVAGATAVFIKPLAPEFILRSLEQFRPQPPQLGVLH